MSGAEQWRIVLSDGSAPLAHVLKEVSTAESTLQSAPAAKIGISASITVDLLGLFLRREAVLAGIRAEILRGEFDDPIGDMERFEEAGADRAILLPFFDNVLPAFEARIRAVDDALVTAKLAELRGRYRLALDRAPSFKGVQLALYHRFGSPAAADGVDAASQVIDRFNDMLRDEAARHRNVQLIDIEGAVQQVGRTAAYDHRFHLRAKAPYSPILLSELAKRLADASRGFGTYFYKAIALDCDNTLWGGVIGEDLLEGIKLDPFDYPGNVFWRVQQELSALESSGLLLCLCTKNNPADVEEVFRKHPHMVLKEEQIVARRVNWQDKVTNLRELAAELNIGLDSMMFLDDSPVEAESVRSRLPMVRMLQVPPALPAYPAILEQVRTLYAAGGISAESRAKTEQYRMRAAAIETQAEFASHEEYLASLEIKVELHVDMASEIPRISELSMKSNQFNLTTRRYSEAEVRALMEGASSEVISITVGNKFGSAGLTGIAILRYDRDVALVDNFLMSCRVLGQGVELSVWSTILERCRARNCAFLEADFLPTAKNAQVAGFYDRLGLELISDDNGHKRYRRAVHGFEPPTSPWIDIAHE
jgi:FkbH-like protein